MSDEPAGLAATLCTIDGVQAEWAHALGRLLEEFGYAARVGAAPGTEGGWYLGDYLAFRPAANAAAPMGADAERLMAVLDSQASLLDAVEEAGGLAAEFADYGMLHRDCAAVTLCRAGEELGAFVPLAPPPRARNARKLAHFPLEFIVARLSIGDAERLEPGDMVIATRGPWPAALPGIRAASSGASFDPASGRLGRGRHNTPDQKETPAMVHTPDTAELSVPVTLRLPDTVVTAAELERLANGGTLELGPVVEGLTVSLSVGGRGIGDGELVRLGDRFAILLENPAANEAEAAAQAQPLAIDAGDAGEG